MQATINDRLVELGTLIDNTDTAVQRNGVEMVEDFFNTHNEGDNVDVDTIAQLLFYLTDIQVRDYALGILNPTEPVQYMTALNLLIKEAPINTAYINAPAALLATMLYELDDTDAAFTMLNNAEDNYSLAQLLRRVFAAGWPGSSFTSMRKQVHPLVTASIYETEVVE